MGLAFGVFAIDLFLPTNRKHLLAWLSVAGLIAILAVGLVVQWGEHTSLYNGLLRVDSYTLFFQCLFLLMGAFIILCSVEYVSKHLTHQGEYYGLILLAVLGMIAMSAATELLTAYISLELMSL